MFDLRYVDLYLWLCTVVSVVFGTAGRGGTKRQQFYQNKGGVRLAVGNLVGLRRIDFLNKRCKCAAVTE